MSESQRKALALSEVRSQLNALIEKRNKLPADQEPTAADVSEMDTATRRVSALEVEYRAALTAEADAEQKRAATDTATEDREAKERRELRERSRIGRFIGACIEGRLLDGAEREYQQAEGLGDHTVPLDLFQVEQRAATDGRVEVREVTPAPATTNEMLDPIVPAIFDRSAAAWLGISMPSVGVGDHGYPVLSTSVTGGPVAKSATAPETAGAFTVTMAQPRRISGGFRFTREDAARLSGMEAALRENISSVLSDALDNQALNGSGSGDGTINGLLNILDDPAAPVSGAETFARYVAAAASHVDGLFAVDLGGVRQLVGVDTYGHMAGAFRSDEDSMTAEGWLMDRTGGVRTSRRIAAPATNVQQAIVRRANPMGDRVAVMPTWAGLRLIRDEYTRAREGEVMVTGFMLVGDVVVLRGGAFVQESYRLA